ncbi:MAG: hydroxylamine reductase, partial [Duncaniella sp.]|nr:hydroxylamine reductase [Duncaniella sp.]
MFCYQCQETARGKGCILQGVCGKHAETSARMDMLLYIVRGISLVNRALREKGLASREASHEVMDALFTTITNANFDDASLDDFILRALKVKYKLQETAMDNNVDLPDLPQIFFTGSPEQADKYESLTGVLAEPDEDKRGLKQLAIYGCKGMAAYARHAANLGYEDEKVYAAIEDAMAETARIDITTDELLALVLKVGEAGVNAMALLDKANTESYGNPEITKVDIGVRNRPGILISGHDLKDLEDLLEQTKDKGVDVYTHSEMLPGQYYPAFKKYPHFAGNYGNAWWKQTDEFEKFNGVFLFTSNCIVPPRRNCTYLDRVYTTGVVGMHSRNILILPVIMATHGGNRLTNLR